jgi:hypothetical protein
LLSLGKIFSPSLLVAAWESIGQGYGVLKLLRNDDNKRDDE